MVVSGCNDGEGIDGNGYHGDDDGDVDNVGVLVTMVVLVVRGSNYGDGVDGNGCKDGDDYDDDDNDDDGDDEMIMVVSGCNDGEGIDGNGYHGDDDGDVDNVGVLVTMVVLVVRGSNYGDGVDGIMVVKMVTIMMIMTVTMTNYKRSNNLQFQQKLEKLMIRQH